MADFCLVDIMDQLWFHHRVFSPENILPPPEEPPSNASSANTYGTQVISDDNSSITSNIQNDDCQDEDGEKEVKEISRPRKLQISLSENKTSTWGESSLSPSPMNRRRRRRPHYLPGERRRLSKTMSCKSLCELELEEVKGFMDLGFDFEKGPLDKRMMSVIPGLQRLELKNNVKKEEEEGEKEVARPYLSEAWLVSRPESLLMNLTIPRTATAEDMKKNLKYWARTVATAVQLESY